MTVWVAFCGGSWLWDGAKPGTTDDSSLGDMVGPFGSWTAAATWALRNFPLEGDEAEQRETLAGLVRRVDPPGNWVQIDLAPAWEPADLGGVLAGMHEHIAAESVTLEAEMDLFWSTRPDLEPLS